MNAPAVYNIRTILISLRITFRLYGNTLAETALLITSNGNQSSFAQRQNATLLPKYGGFQKWGYPKTVGL